MVNSQPGVPAWQKWLLSILSPLFQLFVSTRLRSHTFCKSEWKYFFGSNWRNEKQLVPWKQIFWGQVQRAVIPPGEMLICTVDKKLWLQNDNKSQNCWVKIWHFQRQRSFVVSLVSQHGGIANFAPSHQFDIFWPKASHFCHPKGVFGHFAANYGLTGPSGATPNQNLMLFT